MGHVLLLLTGLCGAASGGSSYIERTIGALEACRADLPAMAETAEGCAARLVEGGRLWVAGQDSLVSELTGRAGGMMMMKALGNATPGPKDVVLLVAETEPVAPAPWPAETLVVSIGACGENEEMACFDARAEALGLVPSFANVMPGWV
ncbi:MAG: hypothetical protein HYV26_19500, partial [Candidatus Hydrogenedentes bacterium]|nr:hypothetical protein [Candidatus Hydrogenedentota bacterium]